VKEYNRKKVIQKWTRETVNRSV